MILRRPLGRTLITLLVVLLLAYGQAQNETVISVEPSASGLYVGAGFGLVYVIPVLHTHLGFSDLLGANVDLRVGLELFPYLYALTADVLYDSPARSTTPVRFYGGGGLRVLLITDYGYGTVGLVPALGILGGANFDLGAVGLFTELEADLAFAADSGLPLVFVLRGGVTFPL